MRVLQSCIILVSHLAALSNANIFNQHNGYNNSDITTNIDKPKLNLHPNHKRINKEEQNNALENTHKLSHRTARRGGEKGRHRTKAKGSLALYDMVNDTLASTVEPMVVVNATDTGTNMDTHTDMDTGTGMDMNMTDIDDVPKQKKQKTSTVKAPVPTQNNRKAKALKPTKSKVSKSKKSKTNKTIKATKKSKGGSGTMPLVPSNAPTFAATVVSTTCSVKATLAYPFDDPDSAAYFGKQSEWMEVYDADNQEDICAGWPLFENPPQSNPYWCTYTHSHGSEGTEIRNYDDYYDDGQYLTSETAQLTLTPGTSYKIHVQKHFCSQNWFPEDWSDHMLAADLNLQNLSSDNQNDLGTWSRPVDMDVDTHLENGEINPEYIKGYVVSLSCDNACDCDTSYSL